MIEISKKDQIAAWLARSLGRYGTAIMALCVGFLAGRIENELSVPGAKAIEAFTGLFAFGERPANLLTWIALFILVAIPITRRLVRHYNIERQYARLFAEKLHRQKSATIAPYDALGVESALTLQICPEMHRGWRMSEVRLRHETEMFSLPEKYRSAYRNYFEDNYDEKRFFDDRAKLMLKENPVAFLDSPRLVLQTKEVWYSYAQFYMHNVAPLPAERDQAVRGAVEGLISFPHSLCLHMVVVTEDGKLLLTKRSQKVDYYPGSWSCSFEEQIDPADLAGGERQVVLTWGKRALLEELGLAEDTYNEDNLRILSVFLESDILNISLCGHVILDLPSSELGERLRSLPRPDYEFTEWCFLDKKDMLSEVFQPGRLYHPSSRYRLLLAAIKQSDEPHVLRALQRWPTE